MTKKETLTYLKAYLDGDTSIGNIIPLRQVLQSAVEYLSVQLPAGLDEAAEEYISGSTPEFGWTIENAFKTGAKWMAGQGVSMQITDNTEWEEVDSFIHKNVDGGSLIQIRKK